MYNKLSLYEFLSLFYKFENYFLLRDASIAMQTGQWSSDEVKSVL